MSAPAPRSGYELAAKILETHPEDAIETLLKYGNGAECDWLEFKAGMTLLPENEEKGDRLDDLYWDYLLSIVAMANTRGGAFVIGVNDKTHDAVPLDSCDPRHVIEKEGKEAYLRKEVIDRLDRPERKWTTKDRVVWSLPESIAPFLDKRIMPYKGTDVIVLLVPPRKLEEEFFVVSKSNLGEFEHLPVRDMGEVGHVKRLTKDREFATHRANREQLLSTPQLGAWWDELDAEQQTAHADESLDEAIRTYHRKLEKDTRRKLRAFIPLDAEGGEADESIDDEFEDPVAISTFDDDDEDWLNSDSRCGQASDGERVSNENDDGEGIDEDVEDDGEEEENRVIKIGLTELLEQRERVVLVGEPGAGKTTCLAHFAVQQGKKERPRPHLFAFIALGRWGEGGSVRELIAIRCGISQAQIDTLLEEKRLHLVLDALNECPDRLRPTALENIRLLLRDHPELPVVLSSRKAEGIRLPGFPIFEVQSMDGEHQRLFLERYLHDTEAAGNILDSLSKQPGGDSIAQNPMLLRMVVDVVHAKGKLPSGRATLYRQWLENWYDREEKKAEKAKDTLPWSKEKSIRLLSQMAFAGRVEGYRDIPIDVARHSLGDQDGGFLDRLCQGPLLEIEEKFVHFRHETIQEYLCAEWLLANPTALDALPKKDYDTWGMPIAYAAELSLPGKLPEGLSEAVWEMNPWIAALSIAQNSLSKSHYNSPNDVLPTAIFSGDVFRNEYLASFFQKEFATGKLFLQPDPALLYLVHLSNSNAKVWSQFEAAYVISISHQHEIEEWFGSKFVSREVKNTNNRCRTKCQNFCLLSRKTMISTIREIIPKAPIADLLNVYFKWFSAATTDAGRTQELFDLFSGPQFQNELPLPIEVASVLLGSFPMGNKSYNTDLEKIFGRGFIGKAISSIEANPNLWKFRSTVNFLKTLSQCGVDIHDAAREFLRMSLMMQEQLSYSPHPSVLGRISKLCALLNEEDALTLLPSLSRFGKSILKSIAFNPNGVCNALYEDLEMPIEDEFPIIAEELNDNAKRLCAVSALLRRSFRMELSKIAKSNKYVFLTSPVFSEGVVCFNLYAFGPSPVIGSIWKVHVRIQPRNKNKKGYEFGLVADNIEPWPAQNGEKDTVEGLETRTNQSSDEPLYKSETKELENRCFPTWVRSLFGGVFKNGKSKIATSLKDISCSSDESTYKSSKRYLQDYIIDDCPPVMNEVFLTRDLTASDSRQRIESELKNKHWEMTIHKISNSRKVLHFVHPFFPQQISYEIKGTQHADSYAVGQQWSVVVGVRVSKKGKYRFVAQSVEPSKTNPACPILGSEQEVMDCSKEVSNIGSDLITNQTADVFTAENNDNFHQAETSEIPPNEEEIAMPFSAATNSKKIYKMIILLDSAQRQRIESELKGVRWEMDVLTISSDKRYLFFHHPSFPDNVFYPTGTKKNKDAFTVGSHWSVIVGINENKKKGTFGFIARNVQPLDTPSQNGASSDNRNTSQPQSSEITLPIAAPTPTPGTAASKLADLIPSTIHVYIDEAWPGSQSVSKKDTGVIAGVVWMGADPDYTMLPPIPTHLRDSGRPQLKRLLNCEKAFPFAFPIRFPKAFEPNQAKYIELFSDAIVLLLGWVLPRPSTQTRVLIHAEHYGSFKDGMDDTDSYRALLAGATSTMNSDRLSRWSIEKVEWQDKEFGYIPYGDLVGYLFAETPYAKQMALEFNVDRWPGCVPFSVELLPTLRDLDTFDPSGAAGALFRLSDLCGKSQLFRHSLRTVLDSAKQRPELRDAILSRLCDEYEKKDRNLRTIGRIADVFFALFSDQTFADKPKLRFLRMLASLQKANHDGNPAAAEQGLSSYGALHSEMEKRDLELCVYADLNVAVHFNDRFEFDKAEKLLRQCKESPSFPYLSAHNRGRLLSSLGQSAALQGRYAEADARFIEALDAFSEVDGELEEETDQTRIYRAFAALDARAPNMRSLLEEALTISLDKAVSRPEAIACYPYREHLLAKALWLLKQADAKTFSDMIAAYVATNEEWKTDRQHPWELTLLYRGLLSFDGKTDISTQCFDALEEWFRSVPHGGVLDLIHAFCLLAERLHCGRELDIGTLESTLASVKNVLPATAPTADALLRIAHGDSPENIAELWSLLPFNYK